MTNKTGPILRIGRHCINLMQVVAVTAIYGDSNWRRYSVCLTGGHRIEVYDSRTHADGHKLPQMEHSDFMKAWSNFLNQNA